MARVVTNQDCAGTARRPVLWAGTSNPATDQPMVLRASRCSWLVIAFLMVVFLAAGLRAQDARRAEYEFKAAFLYKFANFVDWPPILAPSPNNSFVLGVLGEDPFGDVLEKTIDGNTVQGRKVEIRRGKELADLKTCQIVFISATERKRLPHIIESLKATSVLTVGEMDQFCQSGGIINFKKVGKNLRFEVNPDAAERAQLKISSQLLKLAIITKEDGKGEQN